MGLPNRVCSFQTFCCLRLLLHLKLKTHNPSWICLKWGSWNTRSLARAACVGLYGWYCYARQSCRRWNFTPGSLSDRYLQSIFSTRYAHIRKPVRLKPCVQWTPTGGKKKRKDCSKRSKPENPTLHLDWIQGFYLTLLEVQCNTYSNSWQWSVFPFTQFMLCNTRVLSLSQQPCA